MPIIPVKKIGEGGMITDSPEYDLAPNQISVAFNIRYINGVPTRSQGWENLPIDISSFSGSKFIDGYELLNNAQNGLVILLTSATNLTYKVPQTGIRKDSLPSLKSQGSIKFVFYDGGSPIPLDISPNYNTITDYFTFDWSSIYGSLILNTQAGVPYIYSEKDIRFRDLGRWVEDLGADAACNIFTNFKNFYIALNMIESTSGGSQHVGNMIRWSGVVEPPISPGTKAILTFTPTADVTNSLNGKGFVFYNGIKDANHTGGIERNFYYKTSGGVDTPPAVGTNYKQVINIPTNATINQVAVATSNALNASGFFTSSLNGNIVSVTNNNYGPNTAPNFSPTWGALGWAANYTVGIYGNDPTWDETNPNALAGFMYLPDDYDSIIAAKKLGDKLIIYTLKSTYAMSFVGGSYVFSIAKVFMDDGCCGQFAVEEFDGKHFVVGRNDVYIHDGNSKQSIIQGKIKQKFFSSITSLELTKVFKNPGTKDIFIYYSHSPEAVLGKYYDRAWVYNYRDNCWSEVEIPNVETIILGPSVGYRNTSYDAQTQTWNNMGTKAWSDFSSSLIAQKFYYISHNLNKIYIGDEGGKRDGSNYPAYIGRGHIDLDEIFKSQYPIKYIKQILPTIYGNGKLFFDFYTSPAPIAAEEAATSLYGIQLNEREFDLDIASYKLDVQFSGRYFSYRITMEEDGFFAVYGLDFNIESRGIR